jgi:hypothetical protein
VGLGLRVFHGITWMPEIGHKYSYLGSMKLFLFFWFLLVYGTVQAQTPLPQYVGVYYQLKEAGAAYHTLADSALPITTAKARPLKKGEKVLVVAYPIKGWAEVVRAGERYCVRTNSLAVFEKPPVTSSPSTTSPVQSTGTSYREVYTGPRGGRYYYNSNGNKTYIKRR